MAVSLRKGLAAVLCWALACPAYADFRPALTPTVDTVPLGINYQGRLLKDNFPTTGTKIMVFKVYDAATGGTLLWTTGNMDVEVNAGLFAVTLNIPKDVLMGSAQKYLEIDVDINTLSPRDPLLSVPYAKMAETVEGVMEIGPSATLAFTTASLAGYGLVISSDTGRVAVGTVPGTNKSRLEIRPDPTDTYALFVSSQDGTPFLRVNEASGLWLANPLPAALGGTGGSIGGVAGAIPYFTAPGIISGVSGVGNAGELLRSGGAGSPTWLASDSANTASTVVSRDGSGNFSAGIMTGSMTGSASGTATYATNLAGGAANRVPYQAGPSNTAFVPAGNNGDVLSINGSGVPVWTLPGTLPASTAIDLTGGGAGQLPYQAGSGNTTFLAAGVATRVLRSGGAGAPSWLAQTSLNAGTALSLTGNGSDCGVNQFPIGMDASGASESCFAVSPQADLDTHAALTGADGVHGAASANTADRMVLRDASGDFTAGTISATWNGTIPTALSWAANGSDCAAGDSPEGVTAGGAGEGCFDATTQVELTGHITLGSTAHGATAANTLSAIVARDGTGDFSAGTVTAGSWVGNAATATSLAANGGNCGANNAPGGVTAGGAFEGCFSVAPQSTLDTHTALSGTGAHSAASANTLGMIVSRDGSGNFSAGTVTASLAGNANTASAWAADGSDCPAGNAALGVSAAGAGQSCLDVATSVDMTNHANLTSTAHNAASANTFSAIVARDGSGNFSATTITAALSGNASSMTNLAANGSNCGANLSASDLAASGAAETCLDVTTPAEATAHGNLTGTSAHAASSANVADAIVARDGSGNFSANAVVLGVYLQLWSRTKAQLQGITPTAVGQIYYCSDCGPTGVEVDAVVSVGLAVGQFETAGDGAVAWQ